MIWMVWEMKDLTSSNFDAAIAEGVSVVDFWASWCGPCKMLTPILEELSEEMTNINFYKVDADAEMELCSKYAVTSIPSVFIFKNGSMVMAHVGAKPKALMRKFIEDNIK